MAEIYLGGATLVLMERSRWGRARGGGWEGPFRWGLPRGPPTLHPPLRRRCETARAFVPGCPTSCEGWSGAPCRAWGRCIVVGRERTARTFQPTTSSTSPRVVRAYRTVCGHTHVAWLTTPLRTQTDAPVRRADPRGTLLGIRYESVTDQGHVAVLLGEGPDARLLQSIAMSGPGGPRATTPGVNELYTLRECYAKFGCCKFEYALPPEEWLLAM
jgi:hypothetical protein